MNELNRAIGELTAEVRGLRRDVQDDRTTSANHRQGVREELSNIVLRQSHIETDMLALKNKVDGMEEVTIQVKTLRNKAEGAGTLGRWLLKLGGLVAVSRRWFCCCVDVIDGAAAAVNDKAVNGPVHKRIGLTSRGRRNVRPSGRCTRAGVWPDSCLWEMMLA